MDIFSSPLVQIKIGVTSTHLPKQKLNPALEDDPTDRIWSGVNGFAIKRSEQYGKIRIKSHRANIIYKVSRQEIDILNSQLVEATRKAPHIERQESGVDIQILPEPEQIQPDMEYMINRLKQIIRQEFSALEKLSVPTVQKPPSITTVSSSPIFIPKNVGSKVTGKIKHQQQNETSITDALDSLKKLRRLKK